MSHFAKVIDGKVTEVIVIEQDVLNTGHWGILPCGFKPRIILEEEFIYKVAFLYVKTMLVSVIRTIQIEMHLLHHSLILLGILMKHRVHGKHLSLLQK